MNIIAKLHSNLQIDKTVDPEFEKECEDIKELHRRFAYENILSDDNFIYVHRYGSVVTSSREFINLLSQLSQAEKNLGESLHLLSMKESVITVSFLLLVKHIKGNL